MRNYIKRKQENTALNDFIAEEYDVPVVRFKRVSKKISLATISFLLLLSFVFTSYARNELCSVLPSNEATVELAVAPIAAASDKKEVIAIPVGTVKANPFLPYRNLESANVGSEDVPSYNLVAPPEIVNENSDAARAMDTIVSGILYDKFSPSAILNIEGNDYLVKKGDVVNNYKIVNILKDSVTVQLGTNVYKAGIGEILTEGSLNYNDVSNLNNKFGGVQ